MCVCACGVCVCVCVCACRCVSECVCKCVCVCTDGAVMLMKLRSTIISEQMHACMLGLSLLCSF